MSEITSPSATALKIRDEDTGRHRSYATPQTTIEAIAWCVRERGPRALHEPANLERLSRCDDAAIGEIDARIKKLEGGRHHAA
jgi:hypothetical protein